MSQVHRKTVCSRCPKWQLGSCVRLAKVMVAEHPACETGRRLINARDTYRRARAKKNPPSRCCASEDRGQVR